VGGLPSSSSLPASRASSPPIILPPLRLGWRGEERGEDEWVVVDSRVQLPPFREVEASALAARAEEEEESLRMDVDRPVYV
jgi:hypothetical protein